ncbi:MAG: ABC transporter permease [Acidimicrobiia bacterium]|nr:ABC transporter permease [Acidimicrobiia bacterium]
MLGEAVIQAWESVRRNPLRSILTMLGIVWGIASVTLLVAYGAGFRSILVTGFDAFGKSAIIARPGQTSQQAGGERAGRRIRFESADLEAALAEGNLIKMGSVEALARLPVSYRDLIANMAIRGVYPEYGEIRNEVPSQGRWLTHDEVPSHRRRHHDRPASVAAVHRRTHVGYRRSRVDEHSVGFRG